MFILASSVCKSLQCLMSALTQGGEGGHFFRLICSVVLWGGRDTANEYHWCVWGVLSVSRPHWPVCFPGLHCSGSRLLCRGTVQSRFRVSCTSQVLADQVLGYSTKAQTLLDLRFVPFPGPSTSGDQVLGERTLPRWVVHLIISLVPVPGFPGCTVGAPAQVCVCLLWGTGL